MKVSLELVHVAGRLHVVLSNRDRAVPLLVDVDHECRSDHSLDQLAVEQLLSVRAIGIERRLVWIR